MALGFLVNPSNTALFQARYSQKLLIWTRVGLIFWKRQRKIIFYQRLLNSRTHCFCTRHEFTFDIYVNLIPFFKSSIKGIKILHDASGNLGTQKNHNDVLKKNTFD